MLEYKTTGQINVFCGYIGLDERQAKARQTRIKPVGNGVFEILEPICLKSGELIKLDNPDKITLTNLECLACEKPVEKATPKPKAKAKK